MRTNRREFIGAATAATLAFSTASNADASDNARDVKVAVIGLNGRGKNHISGLNKNVVALCDCDERVLAERAHAFSKDYNRKVDTYQDYRELLEHADIDAVAIATPNHTHALISIAAIEAGKDVYVEKPVSHNVWEGRQIVVAAERHGRIVQCGTQSRSSKSLQDAVAWVRSGQLGEIQYALGTCYKPRKSIGKLESPLKIPSHLDYDLWCGPAQLKKIYRPRLHYDWHWDFETGNGDMGNQGIHQMDIARWFLGENQIAPRTISIGARVGYDDAGNTPNSQVVYHDYAKAPLIFETRGLPKSKSAQSNWGDSMDNYRGSRIGVIVQCEGGHVVIPSYSSAVAYDSSGKKIKQWEGSGNHFKNWLSAVAARDASRLNASILEGHLSSALCHVGGVSHNLGKVESTNAIAGKIAHNELLSISFDRLAGHLRANHIDIDSTDGVLTLGQQLELDGKTEKFINNSADNRHLTREYRKNFEVKQV